MKTIIKSGTKRVTECYICGCVFMYEPSDIEGNQHDGVWVTCPQCDSECDLNRHKERYTK